MKTEFAALGLAITLLMSTIANADCTIDQRIGLANAGHLYSTLR